MSKKHNTTWITVIAIAGFLGIGYIAYRVLAKKTVPAGSGDNSNQDTVPQTNGLMKIDQVQYILSHGFFAGSVDTLMGFGDDYIAAWYTGASKNQSTFTLNGTKYNTKGGKSIQPSAATSPNPGTGNESTGQQFTNGVLDVLFNAFPPI